MQIENWHRNEQPYWLIVIVPTGVKNRKRGGKIMEKGYFMLRVTNINRATKNIVASASYRSDEALYSERTDEKLSLEIIQ